MLNGGYTFEKYSVALPEPHTKTGPVAKEARALHAGSHGSGKPGCGHSLIGNNTVYNLA